MKSGLLLFVLVSALMSVTAVSSAQDQHEQPTIEDPAAGARFRWGPLRFTPGIAVTNVGIDDNVFNDPDNKLQATTAAVGPVINLWTKVGPVRVTERSSGQYLYFKEFANQRSWNTANDLKLEMPFARFKPFVQAGYINNRERPGFEIDSRVRAATNSVGLGTSLRLSGKTSLILGGTRTTTAFDEKETFLGAQLASALNRHSDDEMLQVRYTLTPLTTLVISTQATQDRFETDRIRNADSIRVSPAFEFKPYALIAGRASVGFRHFNVLNDRLKDYQGAVASVAVKYLLTTSTQLGAVVDRDLAFSYDELTPYYTLTQTGLTIDQRIRGGWDIRASGSVQSLGYRGLVDSTTNYDRTDTARILGLGVGYLIGETLRIGIDVNYLARRSDIAGRNYDGLRAGASVSYGLQR